jgi:hypothetical protein
MGELDPVERVDCGEGLRVQQAVERIGPLSAGYSGPKAHYAGAGQYWRR